MRLVFDKEDEFKRWIERNVSADKYECYVSSELEILLVPLKSTKPIKYAYFKVNTPEELKIVQEVKKLGVEVYNVKAIEWADDRGVGIKIGGE